MKTIAIGDIHGRTTWKTILNQENDFDKIIFIGDYFDTHYSISQKQQIDNFKDILEFKKNNINKVILLFGNHDFHYLPGIKEKYSGFRPECALEIGELLSDSIKKDLIQMCFVNETTIFTHAGVTITWAKNNNIDFQNLQQSINDLFKYQPNKFCFTPGDGENEEYDNTGNNKTQTPIWVRPESLFLDSILNYCQIVGHTTQKKINNVGNCIFIDTLGTSGEYCVIENDILITKSVKPMN